MSQRVIITNNIMNINLLILIVTLILFIYKITGLYYILPFIISVVNIIITSEKIYDDPDNVLFRIINWFSIIILIIILVINVKILFLVIINNL